MLILQKHFVSITKQIFTGLVEDDINLIHMGPIIVS